ncbi:OB-fold-containig protein [Pleomorphomonas sp. JP5]|uniref:OB-fold-containig protein n=1 Tax=Pleomorphomonas sp. JP5 TaxID=2942998 RepID=UPI0020444FB3|nr:OB-fold-containig protein [Pleomorphomonas sp. JP5]MCM5559232.1 YqiJ family protein [Pleomorphomonas sp. JP5]
METFIQPGTELFWVALLVVAGLGLVELVSLLLGVSASGLLDDGLGYHGLGDHDVGLLGAWMSWLNAGGVPILVLAVLLISAFAVFGFALQAVAGSVFAPLPSLAAGPIALALAVPSTRWLSRGLAKIMPRDETSAVSQTGFVGLVGTVTIGPLDQGQPGVVRVKDSYDNIHTLRAQAAPGYVIETGELVIIADGSDGLFQAIPAPKEFSDVDIKRG